MKNVLKKIINGTEYVFHRTTAHDDVSYYILYTDKKGERKSFKIEKDGFGAWQLSHADANLNQVASQFISTIVGNELLAP
jgi:hypothetical protein